jgi:hypothetical protein
MDPKPELRLSERLEPMPGTVVCPSCGERLPTVLKKEAWIELRVQKGWAAAYRLVMRRGRPVVAELRVFPSERRRDVAGRWSEDPGSVPAEGVPGSALRRLKVSDAIRLFGRFVRTWEERYGTETTERVFGRHGFRPRALRVAKRPGRAGRPDEFYARWAAAYVERLAAGSGHPVSDLATRPPVRIEGFDLSDVIQSRNTVRAIIQEARRRGLLSAGPAGRAGGELTDKAVHILRGIDAPHSAKR